MRKVGERGGARRDELTATKERSENDYVEVTVAKVGGRTSENPRGGGSKTRTLILHQIISAFHTGRAPNLV